MTTLLPRVSYCLETFLRLGSRMPGEGSFDFPVSERDAPENRADIEYLFYQQTVDRCYASTQWTRRIKVYT